MKNEQPATPNSTIHETVCDVYVRRRRQADAVRPVTSGAVPMTQRPNQEAAIRLLTAWLADESGYDERIWPRVQKALQENRSTHRKLFDE